MPVGFNSPARNLFLLGSSGAQVVSNFFESISKASTTDGVFIPDEIRYIDSNKKYALAGSAQDSNSKGFGWLERQDYNLETGTLTTDYSVRIESPQAGVTTTLRAMELDSNDNLIVVGFSGTAPWIAKYSNDGVLDWQSTTNSANVRYLGVTSDSNGNYYACGRTSYALPDTQAFVEKFDSNGNPGWGKSAFMLGRDVVLAKISANSGGHVVAVGFLEDDSANKGYIVKLDTTTGEVLWDRTLERNISGFGLGNPSTGSTDGITPAHVKCTACYIDSRDQIYVAGTIDGNSPNDNGVGEFLIKYSAEGNIVWQRERGTTDYTASDGAPNMVPFDVKSDGETEQTVVLSVEDYGLFALNNSDIFISKYSKNGDLVFRRRISKGGDNLGAACLDADPSFYYIMFRDQQVDGLAGEPDRYTFGKVSTSGNGFGAFQYDDGEDIIDYTVVSNPENKIGRLSDGSVTNSVSDLMTYPFTANKLLFDDLATQVTNKKRQMDSADSFEYSGSPAIRPADFQELNLLGDVYSGSGDWLDQSGKGNNAVTSFTTTTTLPGTTESENFASVTSSYSTYGTVAENTVTNDLPFTAAHYSGKVRDLQTGGFRVDLTGNTTGTDFFMGCWIKFETYTTDRQMGIDNFGDYVYFETQTNGAIAVRHNGGSRADSSATSLNDGNWHHIALSRTGGTLYGFLDGTAVISTTSGVSGNSVNTNENFWFFGGSGTAYNTDAKVLDPFVYVGSGVSSYTVPTAPLIDSDGNINHFSGFSGQEEYISPAISLSGGTTTTTNGPTHNSAGYWEFGGVDDYITLDENSDLANITGDISIEAWFNIDTTNDGNRAIWSKGRTPDPGGGTQTYGLLWVSSSNTIGGLLGNLDGSASSVGQTIITAGQWYHVVLTSDGSNNRIYINGVLDDTNARTSAEIYNTNQSGGVSIGRDARYGNDATRNWDGKIGEVRVYPRALTEAQVFQNYNSTKSKYINEAPDTAPKIGPGIVYDSNLLLNYDFGNRATYDNVNNLLPHSADIRNSQTNWARAGVDIVSTDLKGPFGEYGVVGLVEQTNNGQHTLYDDMPYVYFEGNYTSSCWIKPGTRSYAEIFVNGAGLNEGVQTITGGIRFNFNDGTTTNFGVTNPVFVFTEGPDGWWFCGVRSVIEGNTAIPGQSGTYRFHVRPATATTGDYQGDDSAPAIYIIHPQVSEDSDLPRPWQSSQFSQDMRYVPTYNGAIQSTTVKNLSSTSYTNTIDGAVFNSAGYFDFDGNNQRIYNGSQETIVYNGGTFEAWLYFDDVSNNRGFMTHSSNPSYINFYMPGATSQKMRWEVIGNAGNAYTTILSNTNLTEGQWYHFVGTFDGASTTTLYVNGTQDVQQTNMSNQPTTMTAPIILGEYAGYMDGRIGEARIYNRALSATEVSQNYNATRGKYGV
jgi:hypothetical protein